MTDRPVERAVRIVNLTGHPLELGDGLTFARYEAEGRVRVDSDMRMSERVYLDAHTVIPILDVRESGIVDLPPPEPGVLYVVSGIVANRARGRTDVVSPGRVERGADGSVQRAKALVRILKEKE